MAVVHLDDLDVEVRVERLGRLADEHGEEIDAEAHIAGLDDRGVAGGGGDLLLVLGGQAGRADDVDDARLRGEFGEGDGRGGDGEVEHAVGLGEGLDRLVGDRDAVRRQPGEEAESLPISGAPGRSIAAARVTPGVASTTRISVRPIFPAAPTTTSPMSVITSPCICQLRGYSRAGNAGQTEGPQTRRVARHDAGST